jgi:hypothetical protein
VLNDNFCDWCVAQNTVGCRRETFEALLEDEARRFALLLRFYRTMVHHMDGIAHPSELSPYGVRARKG